MTKGQIARLAFVQSLPLLCSYLFVSMAYGMTMAEAGFGWQWSLLVSMTIYTGAFQFVLITFLSSGASLLTVGLTALAMNSRQMFYTLAFVPEFQQMKRRAIFMIHTMTDETFAVDCTLDLEGQEKREVMFWLAIFAGSYWMLGAVLGGVLGQVIPFSMDGIDFCMTALFVVIFLDQWEKADKHTAAILGLTIGAICLLIFGTSSFMLPALMITSGLLVLAEKREGKA